MKHRDTRQSVQIYPGCYSSTLFEMELWSLSNNLEYTDEEYLEQLMDDGCMDCGLHKEHVGLFKTKERALDDLGMMYEDPWDSDKELYCAFVRERAMCCMMHQGDYLKEWTYIWGELKDESIVRNYAENDNPFHGRPEKMVRFKRGDIVMIPEEYGGHWGIVWGTPISKEQVEKINEHVEREDSISDRTPPILDWSDDSYVILTNGKDPLYGHEHILAHHVLPPEYIIPGFVCNTLEDILHKAEVGESKWLAQK